VRFAWLWVWGEEIDALDSFWEVGMLSCQQTQNVIDGKKRIILNPGEGQKKDFETITFAEGEVYGIDILVSSGEDGKVRLTLLLPLCAGFTS
jgi:ERBB-3 binding protein